MQNCVRMGNNKLNRKGKCILHTRAQMHSNTRYRCKNWIELEENYYNQLIDRLNRAARKFQITESNWEELRPAERRGERKRVNIYSTISDPYHIRFSLHHFTSVNCHDWHAIHSFIRNFRENKQTKQIYRFAATVVRLSLFRSRVPSVSPVFSSLVCFVSKFSHHFVWMFFHSWNSRNKKGLLLCVYVRLSKSAIMLRSIGFDNQ